MKILELGKFYPPYFGGIETLLKSWSEGFVKLGAQVDCVVANEGLRSVHEEINGVRVHRLASAGKAFSTSLCPSYISSPKRYPASVWHSHFPNPLADLAVLLGNPRTPLVVHYHSDIIRQVGLMRFYRPILLRVLRRAARIVVATPQHVQYSPWLPRFKDKCVVIPFGIDLSRFQPTPQISQRAKTLRQGEGGKPIILTVGRLVGYKGQRYLIEALQKVDAVLWIVGTGPLEHALKQQAGELNLEKRVRFLGAVSDEDLPCLMHACDIFALPSITPNEAFGIAQVEAMACGKPVVSCDLPSGVPFVNQHKITGLIVPPRDAPALGNAIKELLTNEGLRYSLAEAAWKRAHEEFDEDTMLRRYWDLLTSVVEP